MSDILLIGSCEPFSGKSAMVLGIAKRLLQEKKKVRIGKPLATCIELTNLPSMSYEGLIDDDVKFIGSTLNIEEENLISSVGLLDNISAEKRIFNKDLLPGKGFDQIEGLVNDDFEGLNILEAAGSLHEGMIYGLSLPQLAKDLDAKVLIVNLWEDCKSVDALLDAKKQLENIDILILNHGIYDLSRENSNYENSIEINALSKFKFLNLFEDIARTNESVSYTHLTLPTILLV